MNKLETNTVHCIIPVHNRLEITKNCLELLKVQDYPLIKIIIVDDGSTDGTGDYLKNCELKNLTVLNGDGNLWWGGSMYLGLNFVKTVANENDYLLMLNDDVIIKKDYISTLVQESTRHKNSVIGSTQRNNVDGGLITSGYHINYFLTQFKALSELSPLQAVDAIPGRGALYPMKAIFAAGNIDGNNFQHYLGDLEFSARVHELGWQLLVSDKAPVYTASESSDLFIRNEGKMKVYFSLRSKNNLVKKILFFSLRGPILLRLWAMPRYFLMRIWFYCKDYLKKLKIRY